MSPGRAASLLAPLLAGSICTRTSVPPPPRASWGESQPCRRARPAALSSWAPTMHNTLRGSCAQELSPVWEDGTDFRARYAWMGPVLVHGQGLCGDTGMGWSWGEVWAGGVGLWLLCDAHYQNL